MKHFIHGIGIAPDAPTGSGAPSFAAPPTIIGQPFVGQTLVAQVGTIANGVSGNRYWLKNGERDSGNTGTADVNRTLVIGDIGASFVFVVEVIGPGGTATAESAAVGPVSAPHNMTLNFNNPANSALLAALAL